MSLKETVVTALESVGRAIGDAAFAVKQTVVRWVFFSLYGIHLIAILAVGELWIM